MKKPKTVIDAESALAAKTAEVVAAKGALNQLERELAAAYAAVRDAQAIADASLPQCRLVRVHWRSGKEEGDARVVIERRTPGGKLVVRHAGDPSGNEYRFKWAEYSGTYRQDWKSSFGVGTMELRDVPAEYLPTRQAA